MVAIGSVSVPPQVEGPVMTVPVGIMSVVTILPGVVVAISVVPTTVAESELSGFVDVTSGIVTPLCIAIETVRESVKVATDETVSVAVMPKENVPVSVGVPEITPVSEFRESPDGREPLTRAKDRTPWLPVVESAWL